ncbi:MAG: PEGA domain-containing protein [Patescibacteria group bacterium]
MKSKLIFAIIWIFLILSFTVAGVTLIVSASGYKVDWQKFEIQKAGLIYFSVNPGNAIVYLDGKPAQPDRRGCIKYLLPGRYDLEIKKPGYLTWNKTIAVEGGLVSSLGKVQLFLENPEIVDVSEKEKSQFAELLPDKHLRVANGSEIRNLTDNNALISRFSYPVKNPRLFPENNRIGFVADDGIRVIDATGSNNNLIVKSDALVEDYYFQASGQSIIYKIGEQFFKARVF